jgi:putative membrane protein
MAYAFGFGHGAGLGFGLGFLNLVGTLLFFLFIVFLIKTVVRGGWRGGWPGRRWERAEDEAPGFRWGPSDARFRASDAHGPGHDQAWQTARERLANGEVTPQEFETLKRGLAHYGEGQPRFDKALNMARMRFAKGEIGLEDLEAIKRALAQA